MNRFFGLLFFIIVLTLSLPGWGESQEFPESPATGYRLFSEKGCFKCHSILGQGGQIGHDLGRIHLKGSRLDVVSNMLNNAETMGYKMKEMKILRPHLTGAEIESLIAFLYYVNYFDEPGDAKRGKKLFESRQCIRCHGGMAQASSRAPALASFPRNISPISLAKILWNHGPRMWSDMLQIGITWPEFEGTELIDLVSYLKAVSQGEESTVASAPGNPNEGKNVFQKKGCTQCHGGSGNKMPNLADPSRGLQENMTRTVSRLWNHAPQMFRRFEEMGVKVPTLSEREMADLVSYIYFLNYFDRPPDIEAGRRLFAEKQCTACHSLEGGAPGVGPDLGVSQKTASASETVAAMWNHTPFMQTLMQEKEIPWPTFSKGELNDLLGYIQSLKR